MAVITENMNPNTYDIDLQNGEQIARLINAEDAKVAAAVEKILPQIGTAIDLLADKLRKGGRLAYFGSGTSGRIGILDASEMPPTYGVPPNMVQAYISGGERAVRYAVENAEDSAECAVVDFTEFAATENDAVVAISASGNPEYTRKVLELARQNGVMTIAITSNPQAAFKPYADVFLCAEVGPEAVSGSSRMKAGTAQKMIVNMLSTGAMIRIGKTYHNYMVDLQIHNAKLYDRAVRYVCEICGVSREQAERALQIADNVKTACVMIAKQCNKVQAEKLLAQNEGILRRIL
ncbi:MAG: N-acetylmuramic acid 6-phosphate etherase [Alphaproteobacteria bacterium]|nr:N-acetylmuramic acid 6-phosphate etherase [Alphaproteobacteria bacterium]